MKKIRVLSPDVAEPSIGTWSNCLRVGDMVCISGMTARANDGTTIVGSDEYEQSRVIFGKIRSLMTAAGATMDDVIKMTIFVTRIENNVQVWKARKEFFQGDFPACSLVEVRALAKPEILVEIEALGRVGCGSGQVRT